MTETQFTRGSANEIAAEYQEAGFVFPIEAIKAGEAQALRDDLEAAEAELADDPERLGLLRSYPDRLLPSLDRLIRNETLVSAASAVLGPDLVVWSSSLFIKEANSPKIVSWHQDLTYWGFEDAQETTCWVALSPATLASGCMKFIPGSHKQQLVPHVDTFDDNNLLSRGQEIAVEVNEAEAVAIELQPGLGVDASWTPVPFIGAEHHRRPPHRFSHPLHEDIDEAADRRPAAGGAGRRPGPPLAISTSPDRREGV